MDINEEYIEKLYGELNYLSRLEKCAVCFLIECFNYLNANNTNVNKYLKDKSNSIIRDKISEKISVLKKIRVNSVKYYLSGSNITKEDILKIILIILIEDTYYRKNYVSTYISAYDIIITICYDDDLYVLLDNIIPNFPYYDVSIYEVCIRHVFNSPLSNNFSEALENYLRMKVANIQKLEIEYLKTKLKELTGHTTNAPLNLYMLYMVYITTHIKDALDGKNMIEEKDPITYTFLDLKNALREINNKIQNIL